MKLKKILLFEKYSKNKSFRKTIKIEDFQILFNVNNVSLNNTTSNLNKNSNKKKENFNNKNLISLKKSLKTKNLKENINNNNNNNNNNNKIKLKKNTNLHKKNELNISKEKNYNLTNINYIPTSTSLSNENLNEKNTKKNKIVKPKIIKHSKFKMTYYNKDDEQKIKKFYIETLRNNKNTTPSKFVLKPDRIGKRIFKKIVPSKKNINIEIIPKDEELNKVKRKKLIFYKIFKK